MGRMCLRGRSKRILRYIGEFFHNFVNATQLSHKPHLRKKNKNIRVNIISDILWFYDCLVSPRD